MFPISQSGLGGNQQRGSRKNEEWTTNCLQLVYSAHRTLSAMCENVDTGEDSAPKEPPGLRCTPVSEELAVEQMAAVFMEQCQALTQILSMPMEGLVRLPLGVILKLITRSLNMSYKDVTALPSLKDLASVLPSLQQSSMEVLCSLILCCNTNLLPQSRLILDLLQRVLVSTGRMESHEKSTTRSWVYRVLSEWLKMAGMGRHFLSHLNYFIQEIVSDVQFIDKPHKEANGIGTAEATAVDDAVSSRATGKGKKKKKNRTADSYKDLSVMNNLNSGVDPGLCKPYVAEATFCGLELSKVILERGQFILLQKLVRHILETTSTLQRTDASSHSAYSQLACRLGLYHVVWVCSQVPLDNGVGTADTVAHFQQTNQALSLISRASHAGSFVEVRSFCQERLFSMHSLGSLSRPIVRKVLPDDKDESQDLSETVREVEKLTEENDSLRKRMLEVEMERHNQARLVASLQQEIVTLRAAQIQERNNAEESEHDSPDDQDDVVLPDNGSEMEVNRENEEEEQETSLAETSLKDLEEEKEVHTKMEDARKGKRKRKGKKKKSLQMNSSTAETPELDSKPGSHSNSGLSPQIKKRAVSSDKDIEKSDVKKMRVVTSNQDTKTEEIQTEPDPEHVQEMLLDFVDAEPDA
ncbi:uncharacterized protein LOC101858891 [Aplysia californica]|uniref:Uncharacterized protein LOC101858891 n=1 Tax=Aplysia californica TaxID=6500 RepID=A0ABM0K2Z8_APLCA|nr:uncharacterized protein LOC101858891 [Aplysia californica]